MFCGKHESQKSIANKCRSSASFRDDWKAAIDSLVVFTYSMVMCATHRTQNIFYRICETGYVSDVLSKARATKSKRKQMSIVAVVSRRLAGGKRCHGSFSV